MCKQDTDSVKVAPESVLSNRGGESRRYTLDQVFTGGHLWGFISGGYLRTPWFPEAHANGCVSEYMSASSWCRYRNQTRRISILHCISDHQQSNRRTEVIDVRQVKSAEVLSVQHTSRARLRNGLHFVGRGVKLYAPSLYRPSMTMTDKHVWVGLRASRHVTMETKPGTAATASAGVADVAAPVGWVIPLSAAGEFVWLRRVDHCRPPVDSIMGFLHSTESRGVKLN